MLEILSEHTCQGWLEGYLLTGRHGLFRAATTRQYFADQRTRRHAYVTQYGEDLPEVRNWRSSAE
ncbi:phosphoketolase [Kribbella aluminosa]|uniref:Phosphoketolase n=1 Tax=Kribbella aluminosa TaxID=416017 RepID=A0ABS4UN68_9ACTN|nr:hypothetical protein [Kribbella aluminosa]MBP2353092.1 phosphoketolase [Kribbella aluminosa]